MGNRKVYVNRDEIFKVLQNVGKHIERGTDAIIECRDAILGCTDVLVDIKGRWVYDENGMDWNLPAWVCSECHAKNDMIPTRVLNRNGGFTGIKNPNAWAGSQYCPSCGARMTRRDVE